MKADRIPWPFQNYRRIAPVPRCPVKGEMGHLRPAAVAVQDHRTGEAHLLPVLAADINPETQP